MRRRTLVALAALVALACRRETPTPKPVPSDKPRVISLAPGITDTLYQIEAGRELVGRSDYCDHPPGVLALPPVGTSLTPSYELISRLGPTLIVGEASASARLRELETIAPTRLLPWLTLADVIESTRELGRLTDRIGPANALATTLGERLDVRAPADGPRVLLVIGYRPGKLDEVWFIRDNSLHGAALRAAGAQNAVPEAVAGLPRLSPERLLAIDPDAILVLALPGKATDDQLEGFRKLTPLRAVEAKQLLVIEAPEAYVHGPRILRLVDRLRQTVSTLRVLEPAHPKDPR